MPILGAGGGAGATAPFLGGVEIGCCRLASWLSPITYATWPAAALNFASRFTCPGFGGPAFASIFGTAALSLDFCLAVLSFGTAEGPFGSGSKVSSWREPGALTLSSPPTSGSVPVDVAAAGAWAMPWLPLAGSRRGGASLTVGGRAVPVVVSFQRQFGTPQYSGCLRALSSTTVATLVRAAAKDTHKEV